MKPPKKKEIHWVATGSTSYYMNNEEVEETVYDEAVGYNEAIDDFHKWIDESPIEKVIDEADDHNLKAAKHNSRGMTYMESRNLPHAIRQMLKGKV